jgi:hypothetical protein
LSDTFSIKNVFKQGHVLSSLLLKICIILCHEEGRGKQDGWKLNGTHQVLVYVDCVNILGGKVQTVKENAEVLVVASKEIRLEVNADKTIYMVMPRD